MNWTEYINKPDVVLNGKTEDGTRLVLLFAEDYKKKMGHDLDISCPKCFRRDFNKFINTKSIMMSKKSGFEVKKKYEGLTHPCSKNVLSTKAIELNNSVAIEFYVEHPLGKKLFQKVPGNVKMLVGKYNKAKEKAAKEAKEAERKAQQEAEHQKRMNAALSAANELGVETQVAGQTKALDVLEKDVEKAQAEKDKADAKRAKEVAKSDKNHDELAHKQAKG